LVQAFATHPSSQLLFWNLSKPDPYYIFPIITAASTYLMSKTMGTGQTTDPTARSMNYVTPVMMLLLTVKYPVALSLYFVTSNVLQIIQQLLTPKPKLITGEAD
jgi:YidC/Oxa1 family membrane protein insertase